LTVLLTVPAWVHAQSFQAGTVISASAVNARFAALEKGPSVISVGYTACQRLDALAKAGANNVLLRADTLYSDANCATSVVGVGCHPFCAAHEISNPAGFSTLCCGPSAYYTKGLVQIVAYGPQP
jgi:hypothetical protein